MTGKLFIVATPIGNLNDITYRAIETLKNVDIVLAEDTRHSKKLFMHFEISTPLKAFHEHNERVKTESIISELNSGISIALIFLDFCRQKKLQELNTFRTKLPLMRQ